METRICATPGCNVVFEVKYPTNRFCRNGHHSPGCKCCVCKNKRHEPKSEEHKRKIGLSLLGKNKKPKPPGFSAIMSKATTRSWANAAIAKRMIESWHRKPNKPEKWLSKFLQKILPGEYQINVNAEVLILAHKCPDFVNINGQKKVIEFNGGWWHGEEYTGRTKEEEERQRIDLFAQEGYQTLIIWESELNNTALLTRKIMWFHNS